MSARITYLINQYPSVSHTFIRREIQALERLGFDVQRIALRGWDMPLVDVLDRRERELTRYVLRGGVAALFGAWCRAALRSPRRLWSASRLALRTARESNRGWPVHLVYAAEACLVAQWAREHGSTHLHAHFATNPAEIAMLAREIGGLPYSFTAHGSDIMDRPAQMGLPLTVGHAAFVAAVCSYGRSQIFKWVPHALWHKVQVVRCGLDPGYGHSTTPGDGSSRRLVCVGRLSKEKGQILLVEAAHRLAQAGVPFQLVLAGDGPMRAEIEMLTHRLGLADRVRITGWLDAQGVEEAIRGACALVVPSLSEGLPVVIMEAMAHARPVIAPYLAGIPELVHDKQTGWLYPVGDVDSLAAAMMQCLSTTSTTLTRMGTAARAEVTRAHDVSTEAAKLAEFFSAPGARAASAPALFPLNQT